MKNINKKINLILLIIITISLNIIGCNKADKEKDSLDKYIKAWSSQSYENMYELLSKDSKEYIDKDTFIKRYSNIYSAIGANNIKIDINKGNKSNPYDMQIIVSMNTIAGDLKFDNFNIDLAKEDGTYKVKWKESLILPNMIKDDKVRVVNNFAERGSILDRNGNKLATNGTVNSIEIHPSVFEAKKEENISKMAQILDIDESYIEDKLNKNTNPEHLVPIVDVSDHEVDKANKLFEMEGVKVYKKNSRVYIQGEALGNLIGYIGEINKEELDKNKGKGYSPYSRIGKSGLESIYEEKLRGKDGAYIYLERGEEKITIQKTNPTNGEDIKLSIDSDLQNKIYNEMNKEKGASIALDPKTGEVLAMVSSPSYDSNTLVTYKTKEIENIYKNSNNAQFQNRANDVYSPGSTMKLITSAIGLESGVINPSEAMEIKDKDWQKDSSWGNYKISRVKGDKLYVNLKDAVKYSDNIYFADKALKIGSDRYIKGSKKFGIGEELKFEYPMQKSQISNNKNLDNKILLADTGYGQGEVLMSPLDVAMVYSSLGNEGNIMTPRLVISENKEAKVYKQAIDSNYIGQLVDVFSAVVNEKDATARIGKIDGINIAGKTGTAEIKKSKEDTNGSENGWFVALNTDTPKIVVSMIIEDVKEKGGSEFVVKKVSNSIKHYLER
ncbi:penicillin-binding transpeptidase domain-containing protein [Clostridium sp. CCUG 7971]|uniref:penicillin-binding transpeptidase domain-containing protein n=1 Tax=Clostridium sp. CCUG 7971 TaxID=2811414 RepID=UPI001ABB708C|nr:penicillin-binding transpeptidase domain-containing protein [Clostridium sp. CCUG 7971]MBO3443522.1 penicillin-binding transpeptidase domain-containing protein [Clostridium sp. CCUG 7971]